MLCSETDKDEVAMERKLATLNWLVENWCKRSLPETTLWVGLVIIIVPLAENWCATKLKSAVSRSKIDTVSLCDVVVDSTAHCDFV